MNLYDCQMLAASIRKRVDNGILNGQQLAIELDHLADALAPCVGTDWRVQTSLSVARSLLALRKTLEALFRLERLISEEVCRRDSD